MEINMQLVGLADLSPTIQTIQPKKLVGQKVNMSLADNKTAQLWRSFMPRRKEIVNHVSSDLLSMQVFEGDFSHFNFDTLHDKWAAVEVADFGHLPENMETFTLPGGLYAVFHYKGAASAFAPTFQYIFYKWLPASDYVVDNRPHFEVIGEKYKHDHPDSEEEIWVPIKPKS